MKAGAEGVNYNIVEWKRLQLLRLCVRLIFFGVCEDNIPTTLLPKY